MVVARGTRGAEVRESGREIKETKEERRNKNRLSSVLRKSQDTLFFVSKGKKTAIRGLKSQRREDDEMGKDSDNRDRKIALRNHHKVVITLFANKAHFSCHTRS